MLVMRFCSHPRFILAVSQIEKYCSQWLEVAGPQRHAANVRTQTDTITSLYYTRLGRWLILTTQLKIRLLVFLP